MFILNCKKYARKRLVQTKRWLESFPIQWFHVIGDETIDSDYMYKPDEHLLIVKCPDTYDALPMKTYSAVSAILELFPECKTLLKTDDDMTCKVESFLGILDVLKRTDYAGEFISAKPEFSTYHYPNVEESNRKPFWIEKTEYCPGRFYSLSRKAAEYIQSHKDYFSKQVFEDYAVGYLVTRMPGATFANIPAPSFFSDV